MIHLSPLRHKRVSSYVVIPFEERLRVIQLLVGAAGHASEWSRTRGTAALPNLRRRRAICRMCVTQLRDRALRFLS